MATAAPVGREPLAAVAVVVGRVSKANMGSSSDHLPSIAKAILESRDGSIVKKKITAYAHTVKNVNDLTLNVAGTAMNLLHFAVAVGTDVRDEIVTFLINDLKMDVNTTYGDEHWTPAHIAAAYGHDTTLKKLLKAGADPYVPDVNGNLVSDIASAYDQPLCVNTIERYCRCPDDTILILDDDEEENMNSTYTKPIISTREESGHRLTITKDPLFNVTLVEDTLISMDNSSSNELFTTASESSGDLQSTVIASSPGKRNSIESISDDELHRRLITYGESPVPVVDSTRELLRRRLRNHELSGSINSTAKNTTNPSKNKVTFDLKNDKGNISTPKKCLFPEVSCDSPSKHLLLPGYSPELNLFAGWLKSEERERESHMKEVRGMFTKLREYYSQQRTSPSFFNYLLIDPRSLKHSHDESFSFVSVNHPPRSDLSKFEEFIKAIFYIGKGQGKRPLSHLYEAAYEFTRQRNLRTNGSGDVLKALRPPSAKVKRIIDIWNSGLGVVSVPVFHNITSDEALARESFMIEAIKLQNVTNIQTGHKKGRLLELQTREKKILGSFLLYKAFLAFLVDGNTQIKIESLRN